MMVPERLPIGQSSCACPHVTSSSSAEKTIGHNSYRLVFVQIASRSAWPLSIETSRCPHLRQVNTGVTGADCDPARPLRPRPSCTKSGAHTYRPGHFQGQGYGTNRLVYSPPGDTIGAACSVSRSRHPHKSIHSCVYTYLFPWPPPTLSNRSTHQQCRLAALQAYTHLVSVHVLQRPTSCPLQRP